MKRDLRLLAAAGAVLLVFSAGAGSAQKSGGTLRVSWFDSPASMSMHEESTLATNRPMMGVFNNVVLFDQHVAQNSPKSIVPELATRRSWNE
jgi:peptide/nickel transport system substrate-binding protein